VLAVVRQRLHLQPQDSNHLVLLRDDASRFTLTDSTLF
jgi:hypothetical protein